MGLFSADSWAPPPPLPHLSSPRWMSLVASNLQMSEAVRRWGIANGKQETMQSCASTFSEQGMGQLMVPGAVPGRWSHQQQGVDGAVLELEEGQGRAAGQEHWADHIRMEGFGASDFHLGEFDVEHWLKEPETEAHDKLIGLQDYLDGVHLPLHNDSFTTSTSPPPTQMLSESEPVVLPTPPPPPPPTKRKPSSTALSAAHKRSKKASDAGPPPASCKRTRPAQVQPQNGIRKRRISAKQPQSRKSSAASSSQGEEEQGQTQKAAAAPSSERESHVIAERRRRRSMNCMLSTLGSLLPADGNNPRPTDRLKVVAQTISYIKGMQQSTKALVQKKAELTVAHTLLHSTHHVLAASGLRRPAPAQSHSGTNSSCEEDGSVSPTSSIHSLPVLTLDIFGAHAFITLTCAKSRPDCFWMTLLLLDQLRFKVLAAQKSTSHQMAYHSIHVKNKEDEKENKDLKSALERLMSSMS